MLEGNNKKEIWYKMSEFENKNNFIKTTKTILEKIKEFKNLEDNSIKNNENTFDNVYLVSEANILSREKKYLSKFKKINNYIKKKGKKIKMSFTTNDFFNDQVLYSPDILYFKKKDRSYLSINENSNSNIFGVVNKYIITWKND